MIRFLPTLCLFSISITCAATSPVNPVLEPFDFDSDRFNTVNDFRTGKYLRPLVSGAGFEWPTVSHIDWNDDGLKDLLVGYNLRKPDKIRMVVYINQGSPGNPLYSGTDGPDSCFYVRALYPGEKSARLFENDGYHSRQHPHKFLVHQTAILDFDHDGLFDILLNEGMIDRQHQRGQWFLHNTGKPGKPEFKAYYLHDPKSFEEMPGGEYQKLLRMFLDPPFKSGLQSFSMLDWNGDRVPDLQYSGSTTHLVFGKLNKQGQWQPSSRKWQEQSPDDDFIFGRNAHMTSADLDDDGLVELIVAHADGLNDSPANGYLSLYRQTGMPPSSEFALVKPVLFTLNDGKNPLFHPDWSWPFLMAKYGWWFPRVTALDFDEDGDIDIVAGWGGGNDQRQYGDRLYLYRSRLIKTNSGKFSKPLYTGF
jgi:hypothetical protein